MISFPAYDAEQSRPHARISCPEPYARHSRRNRTDALKVGMFSKSEIQAIAVAQSAADLNCSPADFSKKKNVIVARTALPPNARKYYKEPIACTMVSYGGNLVASVQPEYRDIIAEYIGRFEPYHCLETPGIHLLNEKLKPYGLAVCFMAGYFLPDPDRLAPRTCRFETRLLTRPDFADMYRPEWSNALCKGRSQLDMICIGAYDGENLIGLAGCSADCESMWQIGIDVLPEFRGKRIGTALVSQLAAETLKRGKVPFYCAAWANLRSIRTALGCGFQPAWAEMTVKPLSVIHELNENTSR